MSDGQPPASRPPQQVDIATALTSLDSIGVISVEPEKERDERLERERVALLHKQRIQIMLLRVFLFGLCVFVAATAACIVAPIFGANVPEKIQGDALSYLSGALLAAGGFAVGVGKRSG